MTTIEEKIVQMRRVLRLIEDELVRAWTKHSSTFNNAHEGYAVIYEELDELWDHVKCDSAYTAEGMKEAIQTGAMCVRYIVELHNHPKSNPETALLLYPKAGLYQPGTNTVE